MVGFETGMVYNAVIFNAAMCSFKSVERQAKNVLP